ncbi:MAG: DUF4436 family protein [Actinomycetota bacterium]|nr:DUF4436 family protein [Actinomycetota bacterium]
MTSSSDFALKPQPRAFSRRGWVVLGVVVLAALALLALILRFYDAEGGIRVTGGVGAAEQAGLIATIEPRSVDPRLGEATVVLSFAWQAPAIGEDDTMLANTRITVITSQGVQQGTYDSGDPVGQVEVTLGLDGEEAAYPFDSHSGLMAISAESFVVADDGTETVTGSVPIGLLADGGVSGWNTAMDLGSGLAPDQLATVTYDRSFSTQVFAMLLLVLSIIIALCAIVAGVLVGTNRRRVEATMLSWVAALLFALPLLRNYMPGSPPVGAAIDVYVYLWVIVVAVAALILFVYGWSMQGRAALRDVRG